MSEDLHAIASQLGRIRVALEKIAVELERYNEKHKWDVQTILYTPAQGYTCWKCGTWVANNSSHYCYSSSINQGASSVSYTTGIPKSSQNDSTLEI